MANAQNSSAAGRQTQPAEASSRGYRFLNPYNFVRTANPPHTSDPDTWLLARCAPPPHDRYIGLTGKIECTLEAVTPLFVADPGTLQPKESDPKGHKTYQFFRYPAADAHSSAPAIPGTSLRGVLRSTFEAATNSCYAHFDYDKRLSYHLAAAEALKLVPARVEQDSGGRWYLHLMTGTAALNIQDRPERLYAGRIERYAALRPGRRSKQPSEAPRSFAPVELGGLKHKDECWVIAEELRFPPVWSVLKVAPSHQDFDGSRLGPRQRILHGYLCITNQNIESKRFERFFFRESPSVNEAKYVPLPDDVRTKYVELVRDYQERHAATVKHWKDINFPPDKPMVVKDERGPAKLEAAFSRFILEDKAELQGGDLVYAKLIGTPQAPQVQYIVPVAVPRVGYESKVAHLLPSHLHKCTEYEALCPACRTFGWVYGAEKDAAELPIEKRTAYAGRIRVSHAQLTNGAEVQPFTTHLAILSSPKPTTTRFYLKPRQGDPQPGVDDFRSGYDYEGNLLRGRKFYRHHGHTGERDYWLDRAREYVARTKPSEQNRTLQDALPPGARFTFSIDFENLAPVELGALLWSLQLEGGQFHRIGLGKPLGFGSVRIAVAGIAILDVAARYQSGEASGFVAAGEAALQKWVDCFKAATSKAYAADFTQVGYIRDLLILLSEPRRNLPIHYPRPTVQPSPEGKNYEWFVGNNRRQRLVLELPEQERGLPLIDQSGATRE